MPLVRTLVRSILFALLATAVALLASASAPAQAATPTRVIRSIDTPELAEVRLINRYRVNAGLPVLRIDGKLSVAAAWMAADLAASGQFSHTDSRGRDPFQRMRAFGYPSDRTYRGENIAAGNEAALATFQQWINSPGHKANILNRNFQVIGIARVYNPDSLYRAYWVTDFGSRWTSAPA